jgi:hypothetical protein
LGVSAAAVAVVRRWIAKPQRNVIVQAFSALRSTQPFSLEYATEIPQVNDNGPEVDEDIKDHVAAVTEARWTEDAHQYLEQIPEGVAAKVLESLTSTQIDCLVNHRSRQQDYIGDYLAYVWEVNSTAFWNHVDVMFTSADGLLIYDSNNVQKLLNYQDMPLSTWTSLLRFFPAVYGDWIVRELDADGRSLQTNSYEGYVLEEISEVVKNQLTDSNSKGAKRAVFCAWLGQLSVDQKGSVDVFLKYVFPEGMPAWMERS